MNIFKFKHEKMKNENLLSLYNKEVISEIIETSCDYIKYNRKNPLCEKAIFLYKEGRKYMFLVENNGDPFIGFLTKKGFVNILETSVSVDIYKIKSSILKNLNDRMKAIKKREENLAKCSANLICIL